MFSNNLNIEKIAHDLNLYILTQITSISPITHSLKQKKQPKRFVESEDESTTSEDADTTTSSSSSSRQPRATIKVC